MKTLALSLVAGTAAFALAGCQPAAEEAPVDDTAGENMEDKGLDGTSSPINPDAAMEAEATGEAMEGEEANPEDDGLGGTSSPINPDAAE